jgi:putative membrane protein
MTTKSMQMALALAAMAALARPAAAQNATQTATAKPPPAAPAQAQPAPGAQPATQDAKDIINFLHARNVRVGEWGRIAQEKGASPNVKNMGVKFQRDSETLDKQLTAVAKDHGVQLADANKLKEDPSFKQSVDTLRKMNGPQFDSSFGDAMAKAREQEVDQLKNMRDRTPGSDAQLKKYLDDFENVMEEHRNLARNVRSEMQRQGRAPGK